MSTRSGRPPANLEESPPAPGTGASCCSAPAAKMITGRFTCLRAVMTGWPVSASSAIPLLYRNGAEVGDVRYVDGGVRDAIPVREARTAGADLILVIRTLPSGISPVPAWRQHMAALSQRQAPDGVVQLLEQHERIYAATQHFIDAPPGDLRIIEIAPRQPLKSRVVGSYPGSRARLPARHPVRPAVPAQDCAAPATAQTCRSWTKYDKQIKP